MLPIIDISHINQSATEHQIAQKVKQAAADYGFFYLSGHGIAADKIDRLRQAQRAFFALEIAKKQEIAINEVNRGYLAQGQAQMHGSATKDQKEVFFWGAELANDHPDILNNTPLCGANQWPDALPALKTAVLDYASEIQRVGSQLLRCIALSLEADGDFFKPHFIESMLRGQLIHYPPTVGSDNDFGVAPHTDFGCVTLLLQETAGLEVWSDERWLPAPPIENTLVINIGDLLERWTNQQLSSTRHRVRNTTGAARYSIAMFYDPSPNAVVNPVDLVALNPDDGSSLMQPVKAAEYILGRNRGAFAHYGEITPHP